MQTKCRVWTFILQYFPSWLTWIWCCMKSLAWATCLSKAQKLHFYVISYPHQQIFILNIPGYRQACETAETLSQPHFLKVPREFNLLDKLQLKGKGSYLRTVFFWRTLHKAGEMAFWYIEPIFRNSPYSHTDMENAKPEWSNNFRKINR